MKKKLLILVFICLSSNEPVDATSIEKHQEINKENSKDSTRLAELNLFWCKMTKTIQDGDFENFKALYHNDAVIVFTYGKNKTSMPIKSILDSWKTGFNNTKEGKQSDEVKFRFSKRIGDESTAHETGIFTFTSKDNNGKIITNLILHFEILLIKKNNNWYILSEYQKSQASLEEWNALDVF